MEGGGIVILLDKCYSFESQNSRNHQKSYRVINRSRIGYSSINQRISRIGDKTTENIVKKKFDKTADNCCFERQINYLCTAKQIRYRYEEIHNSKASIQQAGHNGS